MDFPFGRTVYRLRAGLIEDPYSGEMVEGDWDAPTALTIPGAFVAQSSTSILGDATRTQALESKSLFCDPEFDVRLGDRIFVGVFVPALLPGVDVLTSPVTVPSATVQQGDMYTIDGIPAADVNPWTGWQPAREIPLGRYVEVG